MILKQKASDSKHTFAPLLQGLPTLLSSGLREKVFGYAQQNLAKVQIFIKDPYVALYMTEEKITEMAFVGSIGGVLGLFLGFSFISSVEIIFMVCLRPFLRRMRRRKEIYAESLNQDDDQQQQQQEEVK